MVNGYMLYTYVLILRSSQINKRSNNELIKCDSHYFQHKQSIEIHLMREKHALLSWEGLHEKPAIICYHMTPLEYYIHVL